MELRSIACPISGVEFRCIHHDRPDDVAYLEEWCESLLERMNGGESISLALDCEGYSLCDTPNSGITIQIAEVFGNGYSIKAHDTQCPPVNPKPGVIIFFPIQQTSKKALRSVLSHSRARLITFDFVNDIAVILEAGIKVRLESIIDCQTAPTPRHVRSHMLNTRIRGMAKTLDMASPTSDPLISRAKSLGGKATRNWDALWFVMDHDGTDPFSLVDREFLEYAAADVTITALICADIIKSKQMAACIQNSMKKVAEFKKLMAQGGKNPLYPPVCRAKAFFDRYEQDTYTQIPTAITGPEDAEKALKIWCSARRFTSWKKTFGLNINSPELDERNFNETTRLLTPHLPLLRSLAEPRR